MKRIDSPSILGSFFLLDSPPGGSTLIISAPSSPSILPAMGPLRWTDASNILTPFSAPFAINAPDTTVTLVPANLSLHRRDSLFAPLHDQSFKQFRLGWVLSTCGCSEGFDLG